MLYGNEKLMQQVNQITALYVVLNKQNNRYEKFGSLASQEQSVGELAKNVIIKINDDEQYLNHLLDAVKYAMEDNPARYFGKEIEEIDRLKEAGLDNFRSQFSFLASIEDTPQEFSRKHRRSLKTVREFIEQYEIQPSEETLSNENGWKSAYEIQEVEASQKKNDQDVRDQSSILSQAKDSHSNNDKTNPEDLILGLSILYDADKRIFARSDDSYFVNYPESLRNTKLSHAIESVNSSNPEEFDLKIKLVEMSAMNMINPSRVLEKIIPIKELGLEEFNSALLKIANKDKTINEASNGLVLSIGFHDSNNVLDRSSLSGDDMSKKAKKILNKVNGVQGKENNHPYAKLSEQLGIDKVVNRISNMIK